MNTTILQLVAIYNIQIRLVPFSKLPHIMCSHLISSLDNLMMAYIHGRNMKLYIIYHLLTYYMVQRPS